MTTLTTRTEKDIGMRLRAARKAANYSQVELAALIGSNQGTISNFEIGELPDGIVKFAAAALQTGETPDSLLLVEKDSPDARLSQSRTDAPEESIEALTDLTLSVVELDRIALKEGPVKELGPLPSRIFAEHLKGIVALKTRGGLSVGSAQSTEPPTQQQAARNLKDALHEFVVSHPVDFPKKDAELLQRAAILIERLALTPEPSRAPASPKDRAEDKPNTRKAAEPLPSSRKGRS